MEKPVDFEALIEALEDHGGMIAYILDKRSGEIRLVANDPFLDERDPLVQEMDEDPSRFEIIEPMPSREAFMIMESFVDTLPSGENKRLLERALSWKKPFSNFKSALYEMPKLREQWFAYHKEHMTKYAMKWLRDNDIQ